MTEREKYEKYFRDNQLDPETLNGLEVWEGWQAALSAAPTPPEVEPVAWLHDKEGRVDCIHDSVKQLWIKVGRPTNSVGFYREMVRCKVEHYTIPLYTSPPSPKAAPIPMVLHCPACGMQHIDAPEEDHYSGCAVRHRESWNNPPHRSHLCHGCGHIWRPADVFTTGVEEIKTKGKNDSPSPSPKAEYDAEGNPLNLMAAARDAYFVVKTEHGSNHPAAISLRKFTGEAS